MNLQKHCGVSVSIHMFLVWVFGITVDVLISDKSRTLPLEWCLCCHLQFDFGIMDSEVTFRILQVDSYLSCNSYVFDSWIVFVLVLNSDSSSIPLVCWSLCILSCMFTSGVIVVVVLSSDTFPSLPLGYDKSADLQTHFR